MKKILALALASTLVGAYASAASAQQPMQGDEVSGRSAATVVVPVTPVEGAQIDKSVKSRSINHEKNGNASEFDPQNPGNHKGP